MALAGEIAQLIVQLRLDDSGFSGRLNSAARGLQSFDRPLSRMSRGVGQVGTGLVRLGERAAIAAAGGLTAVVTTAASFEQAFTGVEKTVDGTDAQLSELEETLRGMARSMPVSFEELSAIGEQGGALGVARDSLDEFIDVVARLSVSTNLSSDQAATALGQLGQVLDLTGGEFETFADSLVALGNAGASTEDQIVEMASRFAASGKSAGLTTDEILALSSATASMGVEVEAGGTALSQTFDKVALAIGTGSKEAEAFADILGQSAAEFRRNWERDALGTFQDFLQELSKLDQFEQAAALDQVGITGIRQQRAVRLMAQNYGFLSDQLEVAAGSQGALRKESDKFFDTAQGQFKTFINVVRDGAAIIGEEVLPVTKDILDDLTKAFDNPETRRKLADFGKNLAEGIRGIVDELKGTDFSGLIGGMKLAAEVAKGAFDAFRALPAPVQQLAIAALAANKLSGGAVGQIAKGLGNIAFGGGQGLAGLFGRMRGQTPASPSYVWVVNQGVGGAPGAAGRGVPPWLATLGGAGSLTGLVSLVAGIAAPLIMFNLIPSLVNAPPARSGSLQDPRNRGFTTGGGDTGRDEIVHVIPAGTAAQWQGLMPGFSEAAYNAGVRTIADEVGLLDEPLSELREETRQLHNPLLGIRAINERSALGIEEVRGEVRELQSVTGQELRAVQRLESETARRISDARAAIHESKLALSGKLETSNARLAAIEGKDFSPNVNVGVDVFSQISVNDVVRASIHTRTASGFRGGNMEGA